jgi:hypothetical protein
LGADEWWRDNGSKRGIGDTEMSDTNGEDLTRLALRAMLDPNADNAKLSDLADAIGKKNDEMRRRRQAGCCIYCGRRIGLLGRLRKKGVHSGCSSFAW